MAPDGDPDREITDAEFEQMVAEAGHLAAARLRRNGIDRRRMAAILALRVPLPEMSVAELVAHLEWVVRAAKPDPT